MGRAVDPRVTVRLAPAEHAALEGAAVALGVETGGLLKAAALRGLAGAVADVEAGRLRVRRRSAPRPSSEVAKSEQAAPRGDLVDIKWGDTITPEQREELHGITDYEFTGSPPAPVGDVPSAVGRAVAARRAAGLL